MNIMEWLSQWYKDKCNGEWEHLNSIKIESLDNPGWQIKIDLENTELEGYDIKYSLIEKSPNDWYGLKIQNNVFHAAGDTNKLLFLIEKFREISEQSLLNKSKSQ